MLFAWLNWHIWVHYHQICSMQHSKNSERLNFARFFLSRIKWIFWKEKKLGLKNWKLFVCWKETSGSCSRSWHNFEAFSPSCFAILFEKRDVSDRAENKRQRSHQRIRMQNLNGPWIKNCIKTRFCEQLETANDWHLSWIHH